MPKTKQNIRCPLEHGLDVFGGKWKSRILCVLSAMGVLRYSALRREMGNITDAVKELMEDQLVLRQSYDEIPPRVEYRLTERGESVLPILQSICQWAGQYEKFDYSGTMIHCKKCGYRPTPL